MEYLLIVIAILVLIIIITIINNFKRKLTIYGYNNNINYKLVKKAFITNDLVLPIIKKKNTTTNNIDINFNNERVNHFICKITKEFKNLPLLNNNLKSVKIHKLKVSPFNTIFSKIRITSGEYDIKKNTIIYYDLKKCNNLEHELFHLATAKKTKDFICTGFAYYFRNTIIGYGLNEGYTQLLTNRYFPSCLNSYHYERKIASIIEKIIGEKEMVNLYFSVNLDELVNHLANYIEKKEVLNMLTRIDQFSYVYGYEDIYDKRVSKKLAQYLIDIQNPILKIYYQKYKKKLNKQDYITRFHDHDLTNDLIIKDII